MLCTKVVCGQRQADAEAEEVQAKGGGGGGRDTEGRKTAAGSGQGGVGFYEGRAGRRVPAQGHRLLGLIRVISLLP